jgi:hypothetical protein
MRNLYLVFLALAFSSFGSRTLAQVPEKTNQTQTPNRQLAQQFLQSSQEVVEKDGLFFQTVVSQPNFLIPRRNRNSDRADSSIPIKIGVRIRNNGRKTIRLSAPTFTMPILVGENKQKIPLGEGCRLIILPGESDYPWVMPGQSITFFLEGKIYRRKNLLRMGGPDPLGCFWGSTDLKPGKYKVQFHYHISDDGEVEVYRPERKFLSGLWTGKVLTPPVEFSITID